MATTNREKRREQILDGLFHAMAHRQADSVSISDIAGAANIARGALHYYFESKDEIRACLMRKLGDAYIQNLDAYLNASSAHEPIEPIERLVQFHFGASTSNRVADLMAVWIEFWGQAASDMALNKVVLDVQENARSLCRKVALGAAPQLALLPESTQREISATLLALIEGGLLQWRVALNTDAPLGQTRLAECISAAIQAYLEKTTQMINNNENSLARRSAQ